jgi:hypothetical protein
MTTMTRVMDRETAEHFYTWLETLHRFDQHEAEQAIHALLRDDPDLLLTHSWPEMWAMAKGA